MRIRKSLFLDPSSNQLYGIVALTITIFAFAYSIFLGPAAILLFYAVWAPALIWGSPQLLSRPRGLALLFALPMLTCASVLWSAAPAISLRGSIQYASTVACAVIAARLLAPSTFAKGVILGVGLVLAYSQAVGGYAFDGMDGTFAFAGAFASKNQVGFFATIGLLFSFFALVIARIRRWRLVSLGVGGTSVVTLAMAHSATATLSIGVVLLVTFALYVLLYVPARDRRLLLGLSVMVVVLIGVAGASSTLFDTVLATFGKNTTLTGRTLLWTVGFQTSQQAPLLGMGYQAFWREGFAPAEELWAEFYIATKSGFHFHNTYVETLVALGYVGVSLLVAGILSLLYASFKNSLRKEQYGHLLVFSVVLLMVIRSFVEVDFLYQYNVGTFLVYWSAARIVYFAGGQRRAPVRSFRHGLRPMPPV